MKIKKSDKFKNTFPVSHQVLETDLFKALKPASKMLFITLCRLSNRVADKYGWFYHSFTNLAKESGLHRDSIIQAKKELEGNLFIETYTSPNFRVREANKFRIIEFKQLKR